MTRALVILVAALALVGTATASSSTRRNETVTVRGSGFTTYVTRLLPDATIAVAVYANGEELSYRVVSRRALEFTGRGLLVRFTVPTGEGPGIVRIASMRQSTVHLRLVIAWS